MPAWLFYIAGLGVLLWLSRRKKASGCLAPPGAGGKPSTALQSARYLGPGPGVMWGVGFAPPSQNPPITTEIASEIVSASGPKPEVRAAGRLGVMYSYASSWPELPEPPPAIDATADFDTSPATRTWLPQVIEPTVVPTAAPVAQPRMMARGLVRGPQSLAPHTITFPDVVGGVGVKKKIGSY